MLNVMLKLLQLIMDAEEDVLDYALVDVQAHAEDVLLKKKQKLLQDQKFMMLVVIVLMDAKIQIKMESLGLIVMDVHIHALILVILDVHECVEIVLMDAQDVLMDVVHSVTVNAVQHVKETAHLQVIVLIMVLYVSLVDRVVP